MTLKEALDLMGHNVWVRVRPHVRGSADEDVMPDIIVWSADWIGGGVDDSFVPKELRDYLDWGADDLSIECHPVGRQKPTPMIVVNVYPCPAEARVQPIEPPADAERVTLEIDRKPASFTLRSLLPQIQSEVELIIEDVFAEDRYGVNDHDLYVLRASNGSMLMRSLARSRILPGEAYLGLTPKVKLHEPLPTFIDGTFSTLRGTGCIELWVRLTKKPED